MFAFFIISRSILCRYSDLETFLREEWEASFLTAWDANDMLTLLQTWQQGDVSTIRHSGDLGKCLSSVKPKGLIMPSKTDLYFTVGQVRLIWCVSEFLIALVARRQRDRSIIHEEHS